MAVRFQLLGEVAVLVEDQPLGLGHHQQRCVLAVLVAEVNRPVPADQLVEWIWSDHPPLRGRNAVYGYVSRLRRVLRPVGATIRREPGGYMLSVDESMVDLHRFRDLVAGARSCTAKDDERAMALFDDAIALWHGDAFGGWDMPWCVALRSALHAERRAAELDRVDVALRCGRHAELVGELSVWAADDPFDERVAGQLMLALYRSGRQADALAVHHSLQRALNDELGLGPSPDVRDLQVKILRADPELDLPGERIGPAPTATTAIGPAMTLWQPLGHPLGRPVVPRQLPSATPDFVGRAAERDRMTRTLTCHHSVVGAPRIAVIVGPGGVGKTALAVGIGHDLCAAYPDGQLYVDLHGTGTRPVATGTVLSGFLRGVGVPTELIPEQVAERAALYRSVTAERRLLVVLDDAADECQVRPLLPGSRDCGVIVTSRRTVTGLTGDHPVRLGSLAIGEAVELLRRFLGAGRVDGEPNAATELAQLCGGLPLALRIVGARLAARPHTRLATLADRMTDRSRRLTELRHADLDVRACLARSYQGLAPPARVLLRRLGLLDTAEFPAWVAGALLDTTAADAENALDELVHSHLVEVTGVNGSGHLRYRCHALTHDFAHELVIAGEPEQARHSALARVRGAVLRVVEHAYHTVRSEDYALLQGWSAPNGD